MAANGFNAFIHFLTFTCFNGFFVRKLNNSVIRFKDIREGENQDHVVILEIILLRVRSSSFPFPFPFSFFLFLK